MVIDNFNSVYKDTRTFITGHTGFKGSWLSLWLTNLGSQVSGLSLEPKKISHWNDLQLSSVKSYFGDLRSYEYTEKNLLDADPEIIFHLAAQPLVRESYKLPLETWETNVIGTANLLQASRKLKNLKAIIVITSDKCYENMEIDRGYKEDDILGGHDPYSSSKAATEVLVSSFRRSFYASPESARLVTARAGNVIGGGDWSENRLIPDSIRSSIKNKTIILRNPNFNRPWQFVLEPLKGYLILAKKQYENPLRYSSAWNFGNKSKSITTVSQIVEYIINYWGSGKLKKLSKNKVYEQENLQLNSSKANKLLKWKPTYGIKQSVKVTAEWYYKVLKLKEEPSEVTNKQIENYMHENKWS